MQYAIGASRYIRDLLAVQPHMVTSYRRWRRLERASEVGGRLGISLHSFCT